MALKRRCLIISLQLQKQHIWLPSNFFFTRLSSVRITPSSRYQKKSWSWEEFLIFKFICSGKPVLIYLSGNTWSVLRRVNPQLESSLQKKTGKQVKFEYKHSIDVKVYFEESFYQDQSSLGMYSPELMEWSSKYKRWLKSLYSIIDIFLNQYHNKYS
jgi:hypothetical protein